MAIPAALDVVIADAFALARGLLLAEAVGEAHPKLALLASEAAVLRKGRGGRRVRKRVVRREGILGIE